VRLFLKAMLLIAGYLLVIIALYGFYYFVKDMGRMAKIVGPDVDTSLLTPLNFPRPQLFIVGFVDSLQNFTLGLLAIFAATKITTAKNHD